MNRTYRPGVLLASIVALMFASAISLAGQYGQYSSQGRFDRLTGTYQLDRTRSDDPAAAADRAVRGLPPADRADTMRRLTNRLDPPDVMAIERTGQQVRLASSRAPETTFVANGRDRTEQGFGGRTFTTRATLAVDRLDVSTHGATGNDFSVTFESLYNGSSLRVTRRLYDDRLRQPVVVQSSYRKTSDQPNWDVYTGGDRRSYGAPNPPEYGYGRDGARYAPLVPAGTTLTARLDQSINMRSVRDNEPVGLTVVGARDPRFDGAVVDGVVMTSPNAVNGRTGVMIALNRIRLRDGQTSSFDGTIEAVRGPNGEVIPYNGEQMSANPDQGQEAVERGAVGAAIGALIGAVAGGGKGAAIGAVIGGGGAAATVFVDQLNQGSLPRGTEFTVRSRGR